MGAYFMDKRLDPLKANYCKVSADDRDKLFIEFKQIFCWSREHEALIFSVKGFLLARSKVSENFLTSQILRFCSPSNFSNIKLSFLSSSVPNLSNPFLWQTASVSTLLLSSSPVQAIPPLIAFSDQYLLNFWPPILEYLYDASL